MMTAIYIFIWVYYPLFNNIQHITTISICTAFKDAYMNTHTYELIVSLPCTYLLVEQCNAESNYCEPVVAHFVFTYLLTRNFFLLQSLHCFVCVLHSSHPGVHTAKKFISVSSLHCVWMNFMTEVLCEWTQRFIVSNFPFYSTTLQN